MAMIKMVEIAHHPLESLMQGKLKQIPIDIGFAIPFVPLPDFAAHENEFFSRIGHHITVEETDICKFLPFGPWHFIDQTPFAMHDLVMGENRHEFFRVNVKESKRQVVLMEFPVNGIFRKVSQ